MPLFHYQATLDNFFKRNPLEIGKELVAKKEKFKKTAKFLNFVEV
jgi:hypothetical protein